MVSQLALFNPSLFGTSRATSGAGRSARPCNQEKKPLAYGGVAHSALGALSRQGSTTAASRYGARSSHARSSGTFRLAMSADVRTEVEVEGEAEAEAEAEAEIEAEAEQVLPEADEAEAVEEEASAVSEAEVTELAAEAGALAEEVAENEVDETGVDEVLPCEPWPGRMSVVLVTSEVAPWSKTGGLGDVCGSLPRALVERGHRVMVVAPRYGNYPDALDTCIRQKVWLYGGTHEVGYFHCYRDGVDYCFVDHTTYHRAGNPYGDANGTFGDNQFRFTLLTLAALEAPLSVPFGGHPYGEDVVFMANDWQAALVPVYLAAKYRPAGVYLSARSVVVIHNLFHQGVFGPATFGGLGLPDHWFGALDYQYPPEQRQGSYEEEGHALNYLKAGISCADRVAAVSPGYAYEITTPEGGFGLDGIVGHRWYHLNGILNGIDEDDWSPENDVHLEHNYSASDLSGKAEMKLAVQRELGLREDPNIPLLAFIGRLDPQKGADMLLEAVPWIVSEGAQLVMLGSGKQDLEDGLKWAEGAYRDNVRGWVGFNVPFSHRLTAAADILIMPSRFEPCGLNQMYAMRYGTVPIAHATGGLRDTVITFNPYENEGTGWAFSPATTDALIDSIGKALFTYREHPECWKSLMVRGMTRDCSWDSAASAYEEIFGWSKQDPPITG